MKYLVANWKMYVDTRGAVALAREVLRWTRGKEKLPEIVLCPSFLAIPEVQKVLGHSRIHLGAQDVFWENDGPHTGGISPQALHAAGCAFAIIGHSERRRELGETDVMVAKKVSAALAAGLTPLVCVGETKEAHEAGETLLIVRAQVRQALAGRAHGRVGIVYEPLWAISLYGKGEPESPEALREIFGGLKEEAGEDAILLYGGSVDGANAYSYLREDVVDGVLVGYASVKTHQLGDMLAATCKASHI